MPTSNTRQVFTFNKVFPDFATFEAKVIIPLSSVTGYTGEDGLQHTPEWITGDYSFYSMKYIFELLNNQYKFRYLYHDEEEFLGYFKNLFLTYTPTFFVRSSAIIEDKLSTLISNESRGAKSEVNSESKKSQSTNPYNNTTEDMDVADNFEGSLYNLTSVNKNMIENAALASRAKITGEVTKYIACYSQLFTVVDIVQAQVERYGIDTIKGEKGETGADSVVPGPKGDMGNIGPQGTNGVQGVPGKDGADGRSLNYLGKVQSKSDLPTNAQKDDAYETIDTTDMWIFNGSAWVETTAIMGPQGVPGIMGPQGIQGVPGTSGPSGKDGTDGATGPTGKTGDTGPQGKDGTPGKDGTNATGIDSLNNKVKTSEVGGAKISMLVDGNQKYGLNVGLSGYNGVLTLTDAAGNPMSSLTLGSDGKILADGKEIALKEDISSGGGSLTPPKKVASDTFISHYNEIESAFARGDTVTAFAIPGGKPMRGVPTLLDKQGPKFIEIDGIDVSNDGMSFGDAYLMIGQLYV